VLGIALGWLGWAELLSGVYAGFLLGGVGGLLLSALRLVDRRAYPFGPFMLVGALLGVLVGPHVAAWYA
jgi:leader peptidase (prepilin peptidase)/N-methyltransferase